MGNMGNKYGSGTLSNHTEENEMRTSPAKTQVERAIARGCKVYRGGELDWPYGPNINADSRERLLDWLDAEDLHWTAEPKYHDNGGCLRWVQLGYCRRLNCQDRANTVHRFWVDHVSYWRSKDKRRWCMVSQPYMKVADAIEETRWIKGEPGVRVEVRDDSWYGYGTAFIAIWGGSLLS